MCAPYPHQTSGDWQPSANVESAREALRHAPSFFLEPRPDWRARAFQSLFYDLDAVLVNMAAGVPHFKENAPPSDPTVGLGLGS